MLVDGHLPILPAVKYLFYVPGESFRLFRSGETLYLSSSRGGPVWSVTLFFLNSLEDIKDVCYSLHISPGCGCRVWSYVDDSEPERWLAVCLIGTLHGPHVEQTGVKVDHFLHVYGGLAHSVSVNADSVQLIPWYEYRRWRKQCDWILGASLWVWSGGEDIDTIDVALRAK